MKKIEKKFEDGRRVVTATDPADVRYCRVTVYGADDRVLTRDGPWPTGIAQEKHKEMVSRLKDTAQKGAK